MQSLSIRARSRSRSAGISAPWGSRIIRPILRRQAAAGSWRLATRRARIRVYGRDHLRGGRRPGRGPDCARGRRVHLYAGCDHGRASRQGARRSALPFRRRDPASADNAMKFTRITVNPKQMDGMPCIRGLRNPVATVVGMVAEGMTQAQILKAYPDLEAADI